MRRLSAWIVFAFVALGAPVAAAPAGVIVATEGKYDLYARHGAHGGVCLSLLGPRQGSGDSGCQHVYSPFNPAQAQSYSGRSAPTGLAVPASVARVTAGDASFDTIAADGFDVRFALVTGAARDALLRYYDEGGALIGASQSVTGSYLNRGRGRTIFRAGAVTIAARRSSELASTPLEYDRTVKTTCVSIGSRRGSSASCIADEDLTPSNVSIEPACAPSRELAYGLIARRVRRVELTLGDGSVLKLRPRSLPAGLGPGRLVAGRVPRGLAVRSARAIGAGGAVIGRRTLGYPPSGLPCPRDDSGSGFAIGYAELDASAERPVAEPVTVAEAGGRALRVADGAGVTLCSGLAKLSCGVPPVDATYGYLERHGRVISGLLSPDVATVTFQLGDGTAQEAATTTGDAYTGRYAGRVRFVAAQLPAGAEVKVGVPRNAAGARVGRVFVDPLHSGVHRHRFAVGLEIVDYDYDAGSHVRCLAPRGSAGVLALVSGLCSYGARAVGTSATAAVTCAPRRVVVYGSLRGRRRVALVLRDGRVVRPAVRRVARLGRIFSAVLPRDAGLAALRFRGPGGRRAFRVAPAASQCGYVQSLDQD